MTVAFSRLIAPCLFLWLVASCAVPVKRDTPPVYCRYTSLSAVERTAIPWYVYLFPPLPADAKGKPLQSMQPVTDGTGRVVDWRCPTESSRRIRATLERMLKEKGYTVVDFAGVTRMEVPHSILMISSFYTKPAPVESKDGKGPDRSLLTMVRAKTFDVDLDPAKGREVARVDGVTFYPSAVPVRDLETKSLAILLGLLGDTVSGYLAIDNPSS